MFKREYISYSSFGEKLKKLYYKIDRGGVPSLIVGIANGGLNVSKPLANWFQCEHVSISIHFYDGQKIGGGKPYFYDIPPLPKDMKEILVVDDILDTGTTLKFFMEKTGLVHKENFKIATIHWNDRNGLLNLKPDYWVDKKKENTWIVYPWETEYSAML